MSINLIPTQQKQEKRKQRTMLRLVNLCSVLLLLTVLASAGLWIVNRPLYSKEKTLDAEINTAKNQIISYKTTEDEIAAVNQKLQKINSTSKTNMKGSVVLLELARCTPTKAALKSANFSKDTSSLTLSGEAESRREIARFKEKLEASDYFKNVYFTSSTLNEDSNTVSFSLTAALEKVQ